jgi:enoyl-[acyl-carrier protein] reductase/trans-2-enoyl-CoA reductase (NAD+)
MMALKHNKVSTIMMISPKVRGFICTTAHPEGCAANIDQAIAAIQAQKTVKAGPKRVLIIGASTGYGLASRLMAAFGCEAETIGIAFEKPSTRGRPASPGWYNTVAFEKHAKTTGHRHWSFNGDAFSHDMKQRVAEHIQTVWPEGVDLVIYSIASPRRVDPDTGEVYQSCLKTLEKPYHNKSINIHTGELTEVDIPCATDEERLNTIKVMGGDDWRLWIEALLQGNCLAPSALTLAYSYIGPKMTYPMYRSGTIGAAKKHLEQTAVALNKQLEEAIGGHAYISVNKAVVTQAAAAIPVVPLYCAILYKVMQEQGNHEGCTAQMMRLFAEKLYGDNGIVLDDNQFIRMDDYEMLPAIQEQVSQHFAAAQADNIQEHAALEDYRQAFMQLFGFEVSGVDYNCDVEVDRAIASIKKEASS